MPFRLGEERHHGRKGQCEDKQNTHIHCVLMSRHCSIGTLHQVIQQINRQDEHEDDHERDHDGGASFDALFAVEDLRFVGALFFEFSGDEEILKWSINMLPIKRLRDSSPPEVERMDPNEVPSTPSQLHGLAKHALDLGAG